MFQHGHYTMLVISWRWLRFCLLGIQGPGPGQHQKNICAESATSSSKQTQTKTSCETNKLCKTAITSVDAKKSLRSCEVLNLTLKMICFSLIQIIQYMLRKFNSKSIKNNRLYIEILKILHFLYMFRAYIYIYIYVYIYTYFYI